MDPRWRIDRNARSLESPPTAAARSRRGPSPAVPAARQRSRAEPSDSPQAFHPWRVELDVPVPDPPARTLAPKDSRMDPALNRSSTKGFTLIELIVVVSVLAILAGALIPRVTNHMAQARDARRLSDIQGIQAAIEQFHADKQRYPDSKANSSYGGWDVSNDGDFIPELVQDGYLPSSARDPLNDATYFYSYYLYDKGTAGCKGAGKFYVLGVKSFETAAFAAKNRGYFQCADRDWNAELAYVTGGGTVQE